jgi:hypothetical protein
VPQIAAMLEAYFWQRLDAVEVDIEHDKCIGQCWHILDSIVL